MNKTPSAPRESAGAPDFIEERIVRRVEAKLQAHAVFLGFDLPVYDDPLFRLVTALAGVGGVYVTGIHGSGLAGLATAIFGFYWLGSLAARARRYYRRRVAAAGSGQPAMGVSLLQRPVLRDWLFSVCLIAGVVAGGLALWRTQDGSAFAFFASFAFFLTEVVVGAMRAFVQGYRTG